MFVQYNIHNRWLAEAITRPLLFDNCIRFRNSYSLNIILSRETDGTLSICVGHSHRKPRWYDIIHIYLIALSLRFTPYWLSIFRKAVDNGHYNMYNNHLSTTHPKNKSDAPVSQHHSEGKECETSTLRDT